MDSLLNNSLYFLNNKSELGESNNFSVPNSESEVSPGNTGFSTAQSNNCNVAEIKAEKCIVIILTLNNFRRKMG